MENLKVAGASDVVTSVPDPALCRDAPPRYFGDYEILDEVGRGGMGVVYRAKQLSLNRTVALKLILAGQLASPTEVRRFRIEAEAAARLDHPNIASIYEIGEEGGRHYFSMKFVDGRPLSERLAEVRSCQSPRDIARLVAQVAHAVHYAHQHGILHRDLKPGNVLLDSRYETHLTDFGLAKLLDDYDGLTRSQAIMGTPGYLAPEVAAGQTREVTTAADIYSLGAILYELLTGQPPFREDTIAATLQKVLTAEPRSPRSINPSVARDLETIALKCLEKEPGRRYSSAAAVAEELERFMHGETILARRVSPPERVWRWARRKPALAALVSALYVVCILGVGGIVWQWRRAEVHAANETVARRHAQNALFRVESERVELLLAGGQIDLPIACLARLLRQQPTNEILAARLVSMLSLHSFHPVAAPPLLHEDEINTVEYSPRGHRLVTASRDGTARLWNGTTGERLFTWRHDDEVTLAKFSPDGAVILTGSKDGRARLWDVVRGEPRALEPRHAGPIMAAEFSPDGTQVVTAATDGCTVWDVGSGKAIVRMTGQRDVVSVHYAKNARRIVASSRDGVVQVWNTDTGHPVGTTLTNHWSHKEAWFVPGTPLVVLSDMGFYDWQTGRKVEQLNVPEFFITAAAIIPDGLSMITALSDGSLRVWGTRTAHEITTFRPGHAARHVVLSDDGQRLLSSGEDHTTRIWKTHAGTPIGQPLRHPAPVKQAATSWDGTRLVTLPAGPAAWLWQARLPQPLGAIFEHSGEVHWVRFSRDGQRLLTASRDHTARVWDVESGRPITPPLRHEHWVQSAEFSPDESLIVTASPDQTGRVWDSQSGEQISELKGYASGLMHAVFSPDGNLVATAAFDGSVGIHEARGGKLLRRFEKKGDTFHAVSFHPDGKRVAAGGKEAVYVFDLGTGDAVATLAHGRPVHDVRYTPDGKTIVSVSADQTMRVWNAESGEPLFRPIVLGGPPSRHALSISQDGNWAVTAGDNSALVWSLRTGQPVSPALTHKKKIHAVRFSPSGRLVVTASLDGTARLWDVRTGLPASGALPHGGAVFHAEFSEDSRWLATACADGKARLWEVPDLTHPVPAFLAETAEAIIGQRLGADDQMETVDLKNLLALQSRFAGLPATNWYARWAQWMFGGLHTRRLSPTSSLSVADYVQRQIDTNTLESLRVAALWVPTNALVQARLALRLIEEKNPPDEARAKAHAAWCSRYASQLAPTDPEVQAARQTVLEALKRLVPKERRGPSE